MEPYNKVKSTDCTTNDLLWRRDVLLPLLTTFKMAKSPSSSHVHNSSLIVRNYCNQRSFSVLEKIITHPWKNSRVKNLFQNTIYWIQRSPWRSQLRWIQQLKPENLEITIFESHARGSTPTAALANIWISRGINFISKDHKKKSNLSVNDTAGQTKDSKRSTVLCLRRNSSIVPRITTDSSTKNQSISRWHGLHQHYQIQQHSMVGYHQDQSISTCY